MAAGGSCGRGGGRGRGRGAGRPSGCPRWRVRRHGSGLLVVVVVVVVIVSNRQRENGRGDTAVVVLPGMMYVRERRADSIWATWPAFLVTKWSYVAIHLGGRARAWRTVVVMVFAVVVVIVAAGGVDRLFLLVVSGMMAVRSPVQGMAVVLMINKGGVLKLVKCRRASWLGLH